jgi:hypothetical protein
MAAQQWAAKLPERDARMERFSAFLFLKRDEDSFPPGQPSDRWTIRRI